MAAMMRNQSSNQYVKNRVKSESVYITILTFALGLIIWCTISWNNNGTYNEMLSWIGTAKGSLVILYNLALMLVSGILLGILMGKITTLFSYFINRNKTG
jgi:hypothetical protein